MNEALRIIITAEITELKRQVAAAKSQIEGLEQNGKKGFGNFGKAAAGAGKAVLGAMAIAGTAIMGAGAALLGLAESTQEYREAQARLEASFKTAGMSADAAGETYKQLYAILGDDGQAIEAAQNLARITSNRDDVEEYMMILQGVYATFGESLPIETLTESIDETIKLGEVNGDLSRVLEEVGISVEDFNAQLLMCNDEAEREALIRNTLRDGYSEATKNYRESTAAITEERNAQFELNKAMAEFGAIAAPIMVQLKNLTTELLTTMVPFVTLITEGLTGAFNGSADAGAKLAEGLGGLLDMLVGVVSNVLPKLIEVILQMIPVLVETILAALPQLLATVLSVCVDIIKGVAGMLPELVTTIIAIIPVLIEEIVAAIPDVLAAAVELLMSVVQAVPIIVVELLEVLPQIIETLLVTILNAVPDLLLAAIDLLMGIVNAIPIILKSLLQALPTIITTILDVLLGSLPLILDAAFQLLFAIIDAIPMIIETLFEEVPTIVAAIAAALISRIPTMQKTSAQLCFTLIEAIMQLIPKLGNLIPNVVKAIVNGFKKGIPKIVEIGKDMIKGFWNGMEDMVGWITGKIKGFGNGVLDGIKDFFGIHSPSKVMEDKVGRFLAAGIGEGFMSEIGGVNREIENSLKPLTAARSFSISGNVEALAPLGSGTGSISPIDGNNRFINRLASAMSGDGRPIILKVDKRVLGQVSAEGINDITRLSGEMPLVFA